MEVVSHLSNCLAKHLVGLWDCGDPITPRLLSISFTTFEMRKPFSPSTFHLLWVGIYVWASAQTMLGVAPAAQDT